MEGLLSTGPTRSSYLNYPFCFDIVFSIILFYSKNKITRGKPKGMCFNFHVSNFTFKPRSSDQNRSVENLVEIPIEDLSWQT